MRCRSFVATIGAPLIRPILFKSAVYWVVVSFARLLERFVHFSLIEYNPPGDFFPYLITTFDEFRDATNPAHHELIDILRPLA
jgi:hypothetical protein